MLGNEEQCFDFSGKEEGGKKANKKSIPALNPKQSSHRLFLCLKLILKPFYKLKKIKKGRSL